MKEDKNQPKPKETAEKLPVSAYTGIDNEKLKRAIVNPRDVHK